MRKKSNNKMVIISLRMPKKWLDIIDSLVKLGATPSRSEFIRQAVYNALLPYVSTKQEEKEDDIEFEVLQGRV